MLDLRRSGKGDHGVQLNDLVPAESRAHGRGVARRHPRARLQQLRGARPRDAVSGARTRLVDGLGRWPRFSHADSADAAAGGANVWTLGVVVVEARRAIPRSTRCSFTRSGKSTEWRSTGTPWRRPCLVTTKEEFRLDAGLCHALGRCGTCAWVCHRSPLDRGQLRLPEDGHRQGSAAARRRTHPTRHRRRHRG